MPAAADRSGVQLQQAAFDRNALRRGIPFSVIALLPHARRDRALRTAGRARSTPAALIIASAIARAAPWQLVTGSRPQVVRT
jgi:hypothetical protein